MPAKPDANEFEWLTTAQIAEHMQCTERHVLNMIHRGDLKAYKFGRLYRVHPRDFNKALRPVAGGARGVSY